MSFSEYQAQAGRTLTNNPDNKELQLAVMGLGLAGESGEVIEMLKKHVGHGHGLDIAKLQKELGDVLWYLAAIATLTGLDLGEVAQANIEKLRARYPNGFSHQDSQKRAASDV